jgi:hypothetical protein
MHDLAIKGGKNRVCAAGLGADPAAPLLDDQDPEARGCGNTQVRDGLGWVASSQCCDNGWV